MTGNAIVINSFRRVLSALSAASALYSIFLGFTCLPEPDRNPASTDFAWLQWQWAVAFTGATILLGVAISASRGSLKLALLALMLINGLCGIEPGWHLYRHRISSGFAIHREAGTILPARRSVYEP